MTLPLGVGRFIHQQRCFGVSAMESRLLVAAVAIFLGANAGAGPVIQGASLTIDKPDYSASYAVGASVVASSDVSISSVVVSHFPSNSGAAGQWNLVYQWGDYWWNWADGRPAYSAGPLDGYFSVSAVDSNGITATVELPIPADAEMDFPTMTVVAGASGYVVTADAVERADYYNLWLWDPIDRFYPHSQTVADPSELQPIPTGDLVQGRTYNLYFMAVNNFQTGDFGSVFRSYTLEHITHQSIGMLFQKLMADSTSVGPGSSLFDKAGAAKAYYDVNDVTSSCAVLGAYSKELSAQRNKKVSETQYTGLSAVVMELSAVLPCNKSILPSQ